MTFQLRPDQIDQAWATLKIEVVFAPKTGNIKPWELYGVFTFPHPMRKHWASFKTEAAAKNTGRNILRRRGLGSAAGSVATQGNITRKTVAGGCDDMG